MATIETRQARQTVFVDTFTNGLLGPDIEMLGPVEDGGHVVVGSCAIADVERILLVESQARRHSKIPSKWNRFFERRNTIDRTVQTAANKHLSTTVECDTGGIRYIAGKIRDFATRVNAKQCDRQLLATRSGPSDEERAVIRIKGRISNWMQIFS